MERERERESLGISCSLLVCCFAYDQSVGARADMLEMEQNEFGPKPVLACPLPVFGVTAFATKWGSSASHKSPCRRTARDERVSLIDHFIWDNECAKLITDAGVLHHPDNLSDHSVIYCKLRADIDLKF